MTDGIQRRLSAILCVDVAGYSRLMGADEAGTVAALRRFRGELLEPTVIEHSGEIVKSMGDGWLLAFDSAADAVGCAIILQEELAGHNTFQTRAGLHIGDVTYVDGDIFGDGVNIASRLQEIAKPGAIVISETAKRSIDGKLSDGFNDLGPQELKNIAGAIAAFGWGMSEVAAKPAPPALVNKPSIAVLPFDNMSGDPEQDYFADGITEDIITELARFQNLVVIARNSTFTYKGKATRVKDVARELGVHYVVEGSVRKGGNRVRVTVQLIDSKSEQHVWAERYDRELTDIFELQDEVTMAIIGALPSRLEAADIERVKRKPPQELAAYDYVLQGKILHHHGTKEANAEALQVLEEAIKADPEYAPAYAWKACTLRQSVLRGYADEPDAYNAGRIENAERALALDENDVECLRILCEINMEQEDLDKAEQFHNRAFALNPNDPRMLAQRGELMVWLGKPEDGAEWVQKAMQLDPLGADGFAHLLGRAHRSAGRFEDAITAYKQVHTARYQLHAELAACYAEMGNKPEAANQCAETLRLNNEFSTEDYLAGLSYKNTADRERLRDSLIKAGLPGG